MKAALRPRDFTRFRYSLSSSDSILVRSHEDTETSIGPYDLGFLIAHDGKMLQRVTLRNLPDFRRKDAFFSEAFSTLAAARACAGAVPIYLVAMKYRGDELSPALVFVVVASATTSEVSTLPMFSGGAVDVSRSVPLRLRVWNGLNEGMCNACKTACQITDYEIRNGKPIRMGQRRTRKLYASDQFPESRVRFVP